MAEPLADPVAEPLADPVAEPLADPLADPVAEPLADPVADPLALSEFSLIIALGRCGLPHSQEGRHGFAPIGAVEPIQGSR
jgi:hypothetical protein